MQGLHISMHLSNISFIYDADVKLDTTCIVFVHIIHSDYAIIKLKAVIKKRSSVELFS